MNVVRMHSGDRFLESPRQFVQNPNLSAEFSMEILI